MLGLSALILVGLGLGAGINSALYKNRVEAVYPDTGRFVEVADTSIHVLEAGDQGPLVVMIHGASANAREYQSSLAPLLADTHRVLMVDRPGHGLSARAPEAQQLGVQAELIAGAIRTLAPDQKAVIVGHSFGGAVALRLALDHAELVKAMVLLAPVSHDWGGGGEAWYNKYAASSVIGPVFNQLAPIVGPAQAQQGISGVFAPDLPPEDYFEAAGIGLLFRPDNFRANAKDVRALQAELAAQQARYDQINVPVAVFSGAQDTVIKPQLHVGRLKKQVAGLELVALATSGHMPHHAHAGDVAAKVRAYSGE